MSETTPHSTEFMHRWYAARAFVRTRFNKRPDINAFLFLVGMNELLHPKENFSKEEKQDLMHVGMCKLFEQDGYFRFEYFDTDGWPHYSPTQNIPDLNLREQEQWIKERIVNYFVANGYIS